MRYLLPLLAAALCAASCSTVRRVARSESAPAAKAPDKAASAERFSTEALSAEAGPGGSSAGGAEAGTSAAAGEAATFDECLLISKAAMKLSVLDGAGRPLLVVPIACGENYGDKRRAGDRRTPEGLFTVQEILDTSRWPVPAADAETETETAAAPAAEAGATKAAETDATATAETKAAAEEAKAETTEAAEDEKVAPTGRTKRMKREKSAVRPAPKAPYRSPYGPYFIRLLTPPHEGIGIHGTNDEASIGSRASAGCIRLHNDDLRRLLRYVRIGMPVFITPSADDEAADTADAEANKTE